METAEMKAAFTKIHKDNYWRGGTYRSGQGSDPEETVRLEQLIPGFLLGNGVRTVVDLGCGALGWQRRIVNAVDRYTGIDVVEDVVWGNLSLGVDNTWFEVADITRVKIPKVDLVLCRDVMCHLEYVDALRLLDNVRESQSGMFMATTFVREGRYNPESWQGDKKAFNWYPIVLTEKPFNLPKPKDELWEGGLCRLECGYEDKVLGVWWVKDL